MDASAHLAGLRGDCELLLAAYLADPQAPAWVGTGWDRTELLAHVANVHRWVASQLRLGTDERIRFSEVEPVPDGPELPQAFEAGAAEMIDLLASMDLAATWPTWAGPQPGTFFPRRMAVEAALHRWDADGGPIDAALAVDGVSELLELFVPRLPTERLAGIEGSIHLHATDTEGEWTVQLTPAGITFEPGHAKGDAALRGEAADLLLWSWNRVPVDERFQMFGDAAVLDTWRAVVTF